MMVFRLALWCYARSFSILDHPAMALTKFYKLNPINMPDPIPVMILGRLAIDTKFQNHGLGSALLKDAVQRTLVVCKHAGTRALIVHALNHKAKEFYIHHGFKESPTGENTLMLSIEEIDCHL